MDKIMLIIIFIIGFAFAITSGFIVFLSFSSGRSSRGSLFMFLGSIATCIISVAIMFFSEAPSNVTNQLLNNVFSVFSTKEESPKHKPDSNVAKKLGNSPLLKD